MNILTIVITFFLHTLIQKILHSAIIPHNTTKNKTFEMGEGGWKKGGLEKDAIKWGGAKAS